jgi:YVTN family beta-propeller protein
LLLGGLTIWACGGEESTGPGGEKPPPTVASVAVTPSTATLVSLGETVQLTASASDASGNAVSGKSFTWASSDQAIATVSGTGLVTAVANGAVTISATADNVSGSAAVSVAQDAAQLGFGVQPTDAIVGEPFAPAIQIEVRDANGNVVSTASDAVTLALGANPGGATLSGTVTVNASGGIASFNDLAIDKGGSGYTLTATVGSLASATSTTFDVRYRAAYVTNFTSNDVSVVATASNTVVATVPVGTSPFGVAITPDGAFAYVTLIDSHAVSVIETMTNTVVATISVGTNPQGVAITPDGAFAYVANAGANTVSVIQTSTNTVVATVPVGNFPASVAITPDGAFAYVANVRDNVSVIETASNTVVATVSVGLESRGVAITPDGAFAYVTNATSSTVSVIETASNTVVTTVSVGGGALGVAFTPDGAFAYVATSRANDVSVIATASNTVVATVPVGTLPNGVAITPFP